MQHNTHGGHCCGRRHIFGMNGATTASIRALMYRADLLDDDANKITEIVVSEENNNLEDLKAEIVGAGFQLVAEWDNCSGSRCFMYLHANNWRAFPNGAAVNIQPPAPPPPPHAPRVEYRDRPAEAARVILSTWHNELRTGRGAGFDSFVGAHAAAPRAQSVSRRDVYSDGRIVWTTNVRE